MKTRSSYMSALLNILVIVFTMNATLAHSTCTMSSTANSADSSTELSQQADQSVHSGMSMATQSSAMPCHEKNDSGTASSDSTSLNQCCSDCSVFSLPVDSTKAIPTEHPKIASIALTLTISRSIELPFRPPTNHLS
jgi:hypothetical protein